MKRRSFLGLLAGLPLVGRLVASREAEQCPRAFESCDFSNVEVTLSGIVPGDCDTCNDPLLGEIFKDMDLTRENPPITGHYANYAPRSAINWRPAGPMQVVPQCTPRTPGTA